MSATAAKDRTRARHDARGVLFRRIAAVALALGAAACEGEPAPQDPRIAQGGALYAEYCAICHGDRGEGYRADAANALANQAFLAIASDSFLESGIARGRPGTPMSAWGKERGGPLDAESIEAIRVLVKSWKTVPSVDVDALHVGEGEALRGQSAYDVYCADCHGPSGGGGQFMSINNPELLATASDGFLLKSIAEGRPGTPMPAFAAELGDQAVLDLVALIRSWQKPTSDAPCQLPEEDLGGAWLNEGGPEPPFTEGGDRYISIKTFAQAHAAGSRMVVIDARPPCDYVAGHIPGAVSVPFYAVERYLPQIPAEGWVVTYCRCPHAEANAAADALEAGGHTKVKVINEGLPGWIDAGLPLKEGPTP